MSQPNRVASALECARSGFRVFPVAPRGKKPLHRGWQRKATDDAAVVEAIWAAEPNANIGVLCERGLIVIDADTAWGEQAVHDLGVIDTTTVKTGKGRHFYLLGESRNRTDLLPGVDVRGTGGYVVGPGSRHPSGAEYRWELPPWEVKPAPAPEPLLALLSEKATQTGSSTRTAPAHLASDIEHGTRNATLFQLACSLRGRNGLGYVELLATLTATNTQRCRPPLEAQEVERIARSAASYASAPLWATDPLTFASDSLLGGSERLLLIALARHANDEGICWPGVRRLHANTGLATDTIEHATRALVAANRVKVERRRGKSNHYRLLEKRSGVFHSSQSKQKSGSSVLDGRTPRGGAGA